tara:strand:+ start:530 stop:889 length:360 start_codon:yes stop_codon:yes gene_type:complete
MSLDWSIRSCDNWEELTDNQTERNKTHTLVFATMSIGMKEITKKNYKKFYHRYLAFLPMLWEQPRPEITLEDVRRRVGLTTNASKKSHDGFLRQVGKHYLDAAFYQCEQEEKKKEVNDG